MRSNMVERASLWKVLLLLTLMSDSYGARILGIIPMLTKSHNIVLSSLMRELAASHHEVTVLSFRPQEVPLVNFTDIVINQDFIKQIAVSFDLYKIMDINVFSRTSMLWIIGNTFAENILQQPDVQKLIHSKDKQFDLIIMESFFSEAFLGFAHKFNAPVITVCPFVGTHWMGYMVGNPNPFSYVPDAFLKYDDHMTFIERLYNTIIGVFCYLGHRFYFIPQQDAIMKKYFKGSDPIPNLSELEHNISIVMVNSHVSLSYPKPFVPNIVPVGGMHLKTPKKLPQELQSFLDEAHEGVIYFSMGSALQSSKMPESKQQAFIETFSKLKHKVVWKWEADTKPDLSSNVRTGKWFPQTAILAHRNCHLFITHGGLLSTQEAIYNAVPLVGIPIFGDQHLNMQKAEIAGYGLMLDFDNVTKESLEWAINQVLHQPSYKENVEHLSNVFKDQPETPMERAIYWVEYVIRHKGARHLRSAALDLSWYQYFLLDIIVVLLGIFVSFLLFIYLSCRALMKKLHRGTKKQQTEKRKSVKKSN